MPYDTAQELQGLALSHAACGICGLMPPAGVFVRTAVNLSYGATHRASQILQGIIALLFAAILMPALSYLPQGGGGHPRHGERPHGAHALQIADLAKAEVVLRPPLARGLVVLVP